MSQNLKNNLFRFVTLRSPQAIDEEQKELGFVQYPENSSSVFYPNPQSEASAEFVPYKTKAEVAAINTTLYGFSLWLMQNKKSLTFDKVSQKMQDVGSVLPGDLKLEVWDNLIYQTLNKISAKVREALIQMLVADKFVNYYILNYAGLPDGHGIAIEDIEKVLTRLANASVVIPKEVLIKSDAKPQEVRKLTSPEEQRLVKLLQAKYDLEVLKRLETELKNTQRDYQKQEKAAYEAALSTHEQNVKTILDAGQVQLVNRWNVADQAYEQVEKLVHDPLPDFTYVKSEEINGELLEPKLSSLGYQYLQDKGLLDLDTYSAILKELIQHINATRDSINQLEPKSSKTVQKGGAQVSVKDPFSFTLGLIDNVDAQISELVENNMPANNLSNLLPKSTESASVGDKVCYTVRLITNAMPSGVSGSRDWSFVMGFTYHDEAVSVTGISQSVTFTNDSGTTASTNYDIYGQLGETTKIRLFTDTPQITKPDSAGKPVLSGTITLSNGDTLSFSDIDIDAIATSVALDNLHGSETLTFDCEGTIDTEETTEETTEGTTKATVFGVTNLGIADFRRVEQELCCYVPGEVSHIENIMAREFKERSTTSRITSEEITERLDELERENLTDTTTTERNEMQSEVSSVINEDESRNYGANASVTGTFPGGATYSTGAHFDASSSSSSSNSNTQAQTYAQEITERAMGANCEKNTNKTHLKSLKRVCRE